MTEHGCSFIGSKDGIDTRAHTYTHTQNKREIVTGEMYFMDLARGGYGRGDKGGTAITLQEEDRITHIDSMTDILRGGSLKK